MSVLVRSDALRKLTCVVGLTAEVDKLTALMAYLETNKISFIKDPRSKVPEDVGLYCYQDFNGDYCTFEVTRVWNAQLRFPSCRINDAHLSWILVPV